MEFLGKGRRIPSNATLFSAYASLSASFTLIQQAIRQFVPISVRQYIYDLFKQWFTHKPSSFTSPNKYKLIIEEGSGLRTNQIFDACQIYLCNKLTDSSNVLKVTRAPNEENMSFKLAEGVNFSDNFEGINLEWTFHYVHSSSTAPPSKVYRRQQHQQAHSTFGELSDSMEKSYLALVFDKEHKKKVCISYLPYVVETSKDIIREAKYLKLYDCTSRGYNDNMYASSFTRSVNLTHPFTFENLAMDPEAKKGIKDDLDRFLRRKEFYRRVGKPWKRGYLLYGPPGTGKSSLIAAIANYLKFDIYDLQLRHMCETSLRSLLLWVPSRTIIVVEDIDCTRGLRGQYSRSHHTNQSQVQVQMSPAALLNFVDGLWSSCGDERLFIFTTNHKEMLEPALLRPGRMDMHIHMSYLTMEGFNILAYKYLQVSTNHNLFGEIKTLLETVNVTPADVAEELMRSEDTDMALQGVVELLLKRKKHVADIAARLKLHAEKNRNLAENYRKHRENATITDSDEELFDYSED